MGDFRDFFGGFLIMIAFCFIGLLFAFGGGLMLDQTTTKLHDSGITDNMDPGWEVGYQGRVDLMKNIFFWGARLMPLLGIGIFFITIVRKTRYDKFYGGY